MARFKTTTRFLFGTLFVLAGLNHFANWEFYVGIMPPYMPWHLALVIISGIAEIVFGAALCVRRWVVVAAWGVIALLIAVFPANLHMALHSDLYPTIPPVGLWLRLPVQGVLMVWAYWYTREESAPVTAV